MKKLLLIALLMLTLVFTAVACNPDDTTDDDTTVNDVTEEPTNASDDTTAIPDDDTTVAPDDDTTDEPDTTVAPDDDTTVDPGDDTTKDPGDDTTKEPETTVDPDAPVYVIDPDSINATANITGDPSAANEIASSEVLTAGGRTFVRLVVDQNGIGDPYVAVIGLGSNLTVSNYMAISYRTTCGAIGQFFMGSGAGWGVADAFNADWNQDGEWNLMIVDLSVASSTIVDNVVNFARLDFCAGKGNADGCFDIEYIAFFNSAEAAEKYDAEMHKLPAWDADKAVVAHQSFDQLFNGNCSADEATNNGLNFFQPGQSAGWDKTLTFSDFSVETISYWGWVALKSEVGQFGYQIDNEKIVYSDDFAVVAGSDVVAAAASFGGDYASRMLIRIPLAGLDGTHTIKTIYKDTEGNAVVLCEFTVNLPELPDDIANTFTSDVNSNAENTGLNASDLSNYFTVTYGAGSPTSVVLYNDALVYDYGGINELYCSIDGLSAIQATIEAANGSSWLFVRGVHAMHYANVDPNAAGQYLINNFYETDQDGQCGGAGIYARVEGGILQVMIKQFDASKTAGITNHIYRYSVEGNVLTMADDGTTVYIMVNDKLITTVTLSGEIEAYEGFNLVQPASTFAAKAEIVLADGTVETIENTLVTATHVGQSGLTVRGGEMKFSSLNVLAFSSVDIPDEIYQPEIKTNVALGKPATSDNIENETNIPSNATDGDETTRYGALSNGEANLIVDLEQVYTLTGMEILFENASWNYTISVSTDGEAYTEVYAGGPHSAGRVSISLDNVSAQYIKFTRLPDDGATYYWFSIYEVYVYAADAEETPADQN